MTFCQFKQQEKGGYIKVAAEDIPGFARKGMSLYGNCDDMIVIDWKLDPLIGIYTVYLANQS